MLRWEKELRYSIVIGSEYHDYMTVSIEDYPDRILKCPFSQVKKSLYKIRTLYYRRS